MYIHISTVNVHKIFSAFFFLNTYEGIIQNLQKLGKKVFFSFQVISTISQRLICYPC